MLLQRVPELLSRESKFLFQAKEGYVFRMSIKDSTSMRNQSLLISGSMKKMKAFLSKTPKFKGQQANSGMK